MQVEKLDKDNESMKGCFDDLGIEIGRFKTDAESATVSSCIVLVYR